MILASSVTVVPSLIRESRAARRARKMVDGLGLALVLAAVVAIGFLAHFGMEDIREGLASQLFQQQRDIAALDASLGRLQGALDVAVRSPNQHSRDAVTEDIEVLGAALDSMRQSYTFESVQGASAAHALVHPVLVDLTRWT